MLVKLKVLKVRDGAFTNDDNELVQYYWIKALRLSDEVTFEYGTIAKPGEGETLELDLEKSENAKGKIRWKEVIEK